MSHHSVNSSILFRKEHGLNGKLMSGRRFEWHYRYIYFIYTPNLELAIAIFVREREQDRFRGSHEGAKGSTGGAGGEQGGSRESTEGAPREQGGVAQGSLNCHGYLVPGYSCSRY